MLDKIAFVGKRILTFENKNDLKAIKHWRVFSTLIRKL